jgi:DNA repair exonuclease SbcCD ATPase subunit
MADTSLGAAAAALEAELRRFEQLADLVLRLQLNTEKNLDKAAKAAQEAAQAQERVADAVKELVAAVGRAREKQDAQTEALAKRMVEVQGRRAELSEVLARFESLGSEAGQINELLKDQRDLGAAEERMGGVAEVAEKLRDDAAGRGFSEAARQADSLRQQMLSARNKLRLMKEKLKP